MRLNRWMAIAGMTAALAVAGCGGGDEEDQPATTNPGGVATTEGTATPQAGAQTDEQGKAVFASTCGGCHTLNAAGTSGTVGPNLDDLGPDKQTVLTAIETGPGSMPENLVQGEEAEAVANYVSANAGK